MSKVEVVTPSRYQTGGTEDPAALVVHMTPESVLKTDQYKKWMERFAVSLSENFLPQHFVHRALSGLFLQVSIYDRTPDP